MPTDDTIAAGWQDAGVTDADAECPPGDPGRHRRAGARRRGGGARGAHAAPRVEGRLRRHVGVPRRPGRRRRPPAGRRRGRRRPAAPPPARRWRSAAWRSTRPTSCRSPTGCRRPSRRGGSPRTSSWPGRQRRRGRRRRRRDPRARVARGARGARSPRPRRGRPGARRPGSRCTTSPSTTPSTPPWRRRPRRDPVPHYETRWVTIDGGAVAMWEGDGGYDDERPRRSRAAATGSGCSRTAGASSAS